MIGLLRVRSSSSSLRMGGWRWIVNESAPTSLTIAVDTMAFMPWMSDHHGDDRRHRDDVAEHRHERAQLVRPDGAGAR